jgi:hypothetical protein
MLGHGRAGFGVASDRSLTERNIRFTAQCTVFNTTQRERRSVRELFLRVRYVYKERYKYKVHDRKQGARAGAKQKPGPEQKAQTQQQTFWNPGV